MPSTKLTYLDRQVRLTHLRIERLKQRPRSIFWIKEFAGKCQFDPRLLTAILDEVDEGGILEQIHALRGNDNVKKAKACAETSRKVEVMLLSLYIYSGNRQFLDQAVSKRHVDRITAQAARLILFLHRLISRKNHEPKAA